MNPNRIKEIVVAYQKSRILLSAFELNIFSFLGKGSYNVETIAKELRLNTHATERLLNALVSLQLLKKENEYFSNTEESFKWLSNESPEFLAGLMHSNHLWHTWSHLTDVVKTGHVAHPTDINDRGDEWLDAFIHAMHDRGKKQASTQISAIDMSQVESVLDVGGGSGCFSMAFLNKKPGIHSAIFDLPNVVTISKKIVNEEGYTDKIHYYVGDFTKDELPKGFDLVFLSAIIHSNSYKINEALVAKCYEALNPGGQLVINDWIMNEDKTEPLSGAIFAINMLVGVAEGDCYSEKEVSSWMKKAGFKNISKNILDQGLSQMIAVKKD